MKKITFLFALFLSFVGATQMSADTVTYGNTFGDNQAISVSSTAATSIDTTKWYVIKNVNKGYWQDSESGAWKTVSGASINDQMAKDKAGFLFKLQAATDTTYNIVSANGASVSLVLSGWGSSTTALTTPFETFTIKNIGESTDHWYIQQISNSAIADGNGNVVGWGTSAPTTTGGNNDHQFFEVTLVEAQDYHITPSNTKVYTISTSSRGNWAYDSTYTVNNEKFNGLVSTQCSTAPTISNENQKYFAVLTSNKGNYYIYSVAAKKFVSADGSKTSLSVAPTTSNTQLYDNVSNSRNYPYVVIIDSHQIAVSNGYTDRGGIISDYNDYTDVGNQVRIAEVEGETFDSVAAIARINIFEALATTYTTGSAYGQYNDPDNAYTNARTVATAALNDTAATDSTLTAALSALTTATNALTFNVPATGSFLRIKSHNATSAYLSGDNSTTQTSRAAFVDNATDDDNAKNTIFYYDSNNYLVNYGSGYYLYDSNNQALYSGIQTSGTKVTFEKAPSVTNGGNYVVKFKNASRYLYAQDGDYSDAGNSCTEAKYTFELEAVTELPVTVTSAGWATLYAPVALTIPENVKAYTAVMNDNTATLTEVTGTIPANTGVVLQASEGTYNFAIATGTTTNSDSNVLTGSIASVNIASGTQAYILANGTQGVGFYLMNSENDRTVHGCRAYYNGGTTSSASAFIFDFGGTATGISAIATDNSNSNAPIFDLSGRRVAKATKGIYIQNGKKIYVK